MKQFSPDGGALYKIALVRLFLGLTIRFLFAYTSCMSEERDRGALLIAACLVAAIRLRGEPIQPSPKLKATIYDSVQLAVLIWREIQGRGPKLLN